MATVAALGGLLGCKQILDLDDFTDTAQASSTTGGGEGGSGAGGGPPGRCGGFGALADDFEDGLLSATAERPGWRPAVENGAASEAGGEAILSLTPVQGTAIAQLGAARRADLRNDAVAVEVPQTSMYHTVRFWLEFDGNNNVSFEAVAQTELRAISFLNGRAEQLATDSYDATEHAHWRFVEDNGFLRWETSADGASWNLLTSVGTNTLGFSLEAMRLKLDAFVNQGTDMMDEAAFDNLNDTTAARPWCLASSFQDDFSDRKMGDGWLESVIGGACTSLEANDKVSFSWTGGAVCFYRTSTAFDLTGDSVTVEVPSIDVDPLLKVYLRVHLDGENYVDLRQERGTDGDEIVAAKVIAGTGSQLATTQYNAMDHRWWRIREAGGTMYWETSADGIMWQELVSIPAPIPTRAVDIAFGIDAQVGVTGGSAEFRNYNLPPR